MFSDEHQDSRSNAIVPRPGTDLAETGRRVNPVIARMARDVLALAESQGLSAARYRIEEYLLREPDYRQILDWAAALGRAPEWVLKQLADSRLEPAVWDFFDPITLVIEDGTIRSLTWDFERLPLVPRHWQEGLLIRSLGLTGTRSDSRQTLRPDLAWLQILVCRNFEITNIDLSRTPELIKLDCGDNQLTALDLSPGQALTKLDCGHKQFTTLDLSSVPGLTTLNCEGNQLTALDLSPVPGLTTLFCWRNQLTMLDLAPVPGLTRLECDQSVRLINTPANLKVQRR